ncbi:hypothetical protein CSKR_103045 [Clonorchis sinensis]|uniref:Uncharacterized protein n=1 Tax=Clonorchis sinensis TaxID=79923 RepID=A0A3R7D3M6_CLOSI|nr:hypothetical protein CSKR_103045 [Clonorchis sinensis]
MPVRWPEWVRIGAQLVSLFLLIPIPTIFLRTVGIKWRSTNGSLGKWDISLCVSCGLHFQHVGTNVVLHVTQADPLV